MYANVTDKNRRIYSAMVTAMDDVVGAVVSELKTQKMWDNTLTVFTTGIILKIGVLHLLDF